MSEGVRPWPRVPGTTVSLDGAARPAAGVSGHHGEIMRLAVVDDGLLAGETLPATAAGLDYQISFDDYDLFPTTSNLATAMTEAGEYGLAIAYGDRASAMADDGTGNIAIDIGSNTGPGDEVVADDGNGNLAIGLGSNSGLSDQVVATYDIFSALGHETGALPASLVTLLTDLSALS